MKTKKLVLWIFIIFLLLSIPIIWINLYGKNDVPVTVYLKPGIITNDVANLLFSRQVIRSKILFVLILRITGGDKKIYAGGYRFPSRVRLMQVIKFLRLGMTVFEKVTIPEGYTSHQIATLLQEKGWDTDNTFLHLVQSQKLEGYLYPETYFIEKGLNNDKIIKLMVSQFNNVLNSGITDEIKKRKLAIPKVITLASIIEKEARVEDRTLISAVFQNRLKKRWYLESCATVHYARELAGLPKKKSLTYRDLQINSSYNTYRRYGLPPGPICNPGLDSIKAAINPAESDALFFVVTPTGTHTFSKYYTDHLRIQRIMKKKQKF